MLATFLLASTVGLLFDSWIGFFVIIGLQLVNLWACKEMKDFSGLPGGETFHHKLVLWWTKLDLLVNWLSKGNRWSYTYSGLARICFQHVGARTGKRFVTPVRTYLLDDYANMARAALTLREITGKAFYLERAEQWTEILNEHFWDEKGGGYFYTADDAEALIVRSKNAQDNAVPSGNGTMLEVLAKLHLLSGAREPFEKATNLLRCFSVELARNFFPLATLLNNFETLVNARQVVIVGRRSDAEVIDIINVLKDISLPSKVVNILEDTENLPFDHPAKGKGKLDGKPTVYLCTGPTCSPPANNVAAFAALLKETTAHGAT